MTKSHPSKALAWLEQAQKELGTRRISSALRWHYDASVPLNAYYELADLLDRKAYFEGYKDWKKKTPVNASLSCATLVYHSLCHEKDTHFLMRSAKDYSDMGLWLDVPETGLKALSAILDNLTSSVNVIGLRYKAENHPFEKDLIRHLSEQSTPTPWLLWPYGFSPRQYLETNAHRTIPSTCRHLPIDGYTPAEKGASPSDQIGLMLAQCIEYLKQASKRKLDLQQVWKRLFFLSGIGLDYFHEIAKLRALKEALSQVAAAYDLKLSLNEPYIVGIHNGNMHTGSDVSMNLLRNTTQSMSALIGGCQALVVRPHACDTHGQESHLSRRLSAQLVRMLKQESALTMPDPASGAYFIEYLTDALAKTGWQFMQSIEQKGGIEAPQVKKWLHTRIQKQRKQIQDLIASQKNIHIGINAYATPHPPPLSKSSKQHPLLTQPPYRFEEPYEALRHQFKQALSRHKNPNFYVYSPVPSMKHMATGATSPTSFLTSAWSLLGLSPPKSIRSLNRELSNSLLHICLSQGESIEKYLSQLQTIPLCLWIIGHFKDAVPYKSAKYANLEYHVLNLSKGDFYTHLRMIVTHSF